MVCSVAPSDKQIILIGPAHPLRPGGITTFNERLCRAFMEAGYPCTIWSFRLQYPAFLFPGSSQFTTQPAPENTPIVSAINSVNPFNWIKTGLAIRKLQPDLVVVRYWIPFMGPCLGTILRIIRGNRHTRIVCIADNIIPHEKRPGDRCFTSYFVKPVHRFIVMSRQVMNDLRGFTPAPAHLLPHPLYDNFGPGISKTAARIWLNQKLGVTISSGDKILLFFGLIRSYKGLDLLLEAMQQIPDDSIRLLIAGEFYENREKYSQWLEAPEMKNRLFLYPHFVANEEVKYFFCAADGVVQPYRHATQSGVTPLAYHFEVPMIVTNVGGLPEMVPHQQAGLVCEPTAHALAQSIQSFFETGSSAFEPSLRRIKKDLSWKIFVEKIMQETFGNHPHQQDGK